ncbi:HK97 gp10 family phage protein [Paenibacillus sp. GYB004]|uniref:HK97 gp10 family phage protein n=1 Tax=Paenibacillus sp. GYB004 TaxID=2994393 RepID=UPI002F96786D
MADFEAEDKGLDRFAKELNDLQRLFPKQARQLMMRSGTKARAIVSKRARRTVQKKSGNYHKSIKRGKVWVDLSTDETKVRVYSGAPHSHLIEYGHRIVGKDGSEHGFKQGHYVFEKATAEIEREWTNILENEFDRILKKL